VTERLAAEAMEPLGQVAADTVVDQEGRILALVECGRRWPALQAAPDSTLGEMLDELAIAEQLQAGNPGVVVADDGRPLGIVTRTTLLEYMRTGYRAAAALLGDETLPGIPRMPPLVIECSTCHQRNELREFIEGSTPCVNGHVLSVDWD
jgi:CBS domain-containing protein